MHVHQPQSTAESGEDHSTGEDRSTSAMSHLDTPCTSSSTETSLYDDAQDARRAVTFEPAVLLAIWALFVLIDGNDQILEALSSNNSSAIPKAVNLIAAFFELFTAVSGLCLSIASIIASARVRYYIARIQAVHFVTSIYIVLSYALSSSFISPMSISAMTSIPTAVARFQLFSIPLLITGWFSRNTSIRTRAIFSSIPPVFAGISILTVTLYAMFTTESQSMLYPVPSPAGRFPLLTFFSAILLCFWAISGVFVICSKTVNLAIRFYMYGGCGIFLLCLINFSMLQPILAVSFRPSFPTAGFLGVYSTSALIPLLFALILPPPFLLGLYAERERAKGTRKPDGFDDSIMLELRRSFSQLEAIFPKRLKPIITPSTTATSETNSSDASVLDSQFSIARYLNDDIEAPPSRYLYDNNSPTFQETVDTDEYDAHAT